MDLAEARTRLPALADLDDTSFVEAVQELYYPDTPVATLAAELGVKAAPVPTPSATIGDRIKDTGVSLMKGGVGAVQGVVGLADLATKGAAGKAVEDAGIDLKGAQQYWGEKYSPAQKAAFEKFEQADGVVDKTVAAVTNPSIVAQTAVESLPAMAVGGLIGRGAMAIAPKIGGAVAAGAGEGAIMAGTQAEAIRGETADGRLTGEQVGLSALTGVAGGAIGVFGAKLAKSFGLADVDALMAGVATSPIAAKSVTRQVLQGAVTEGFLEELPQSVVEQVLQNKALGKPLDEGVDTAAVLGTLTGGAMGGAVNFASGITKPRATAEDVLAAPDVDSAIAAAQEAVKTPVVVAPVAPVASTPEAEEDPFSAPIPTALPASVAAPIAAATSGTPAVSITGTDPATLMQRPNPLMEAATGEDQRQEELAAQAMDRMSRDAVDDGQALREFPASTLPRKMPTEPALPEVDEAIQPGDILQKNGALWPEKGAQLKAKSVGGTVVAVNGGFIVRPAVKETAPNIEQAAPVAALVKAAPQPKAADAQTPQSAQAAAPVPAPAVDTAQVPAQPAGSGAAVATGASEQRDDALSALRKKWPGLANEPDAVVQAAEAWSGAENRLKGLLDFTPLAQERVDAIRSEVIDAMGGESGIRKAGQLPYLTRLTERLTAAADEVQAEQNDPATLAGKRQEKKDAAAREETAAAMQKATEQDIAFNLARVRKLVEQGRISEQDSQRLLDLARSSTDGFDAAMKLEGFVSDKEVPGRVGEVRPGAATAANDSPNVQNQSQPAVTPKAQAQSPQASPPARSNAPGGTATATQPGADALEAPGLSPTNEPQSEPADPKRQVVELRKRASVLKSLIQCLGA